jgi:PPP family 3-phenylpropionic acid transporter
LPPALGPVPLMLVGGLGATLRWAVMAFDPAGWALPLVQVLHALSFGATHLGAIAFIAHAAPEGRSATAQGYFSVVQGVTFSACMLLAGVLYEAVGVASYGAMALTALIGTAITATMLVRADSKA